MLTKDRFNKMLMCISINFSYENCESSCSRRSVDRLTLAHLSSDKILQHALILKDIRKRLSEANK